MIDMEHNPLNMEAVANFIAFSNDRAYTAKRGDAQPKVAIIARFPPYPSDSAAWIAKQALDMGLMGIVFNTVNTKEEAIAAVRQMRYAPQRNDPNTQKGPAGFRGYRSGIGESAPPNINAVPTSGRSIPTAISSASF